MWFFFNFSKKIGRGHIKTQMNQLLVVPQGSNNVTFFRGSFPHPYLLTTCRAQLELSKQIIVQLIPAQKIANFNGKLLQDPTGSRTTRVRTITKNPLGTHKIF